MIDKFFLHSKYSPTGDQPNAINELCDGVLNGKRDQVLLGATGTGKTFTIANVIQKVQRPVILMAHNKTLAAQLYSEMKEFFPHNAVEYFVSYYDYYQPEAYIPHTDTYIEKSSVINEYIDTMRHSATKSILERRDVIIVASVSGIYGLGNPKEYLDMRCHLYPGLEIDIKAAEKTLEALQYERNSIEFVRGKFKIHTNVIEIFIPSGEGIIFKIEFQNNIIINIIKKDTISNKIESVDEVFIYPNGHYVTPMHKIQNCISLIKEELRQQVEYFIGIGKYAEADRIKQKVSYDIDMLLEIGTCKGIENYSRYFDDRKAGEPPYTLFDFLPKDGLVLIDESHVTVPQIRGMQAADRARKINLINHGFRLPSAIDNRPLNFDEWNKIRTQTIYISATPGKFELEQTNHTKIEQIIRPTGLLDPTIEIHPTENQVSDVIEKVPDVIQNGDRVICVTLTKKMAENLNNYFLEMGIRSRYIHSDVETIERISILKNFRQGNIDVLIGVNLLREGIDVPECSLVAIMDADKEGFLRSETSLIQTIGRAARNENGRVILYADRITKAMEYAINETKRRRALQERHNILHGITPKTIRKEISQVFDEMINSDNKKKNRTQPDINIINIDSSTLTPKELKQFISITKKKMKEAADKLEFKEAAMYRDVLLKIQNTKKQSSTVV